MSVTMLQSGMYSGTTTKNARWELQWKVTKTSTDGISKLDFVLYKTQNATSSNNVTNGCVFNFSLGSDCTMINTDSYPSRIYRAFSNNVPDYNSTQEIMEFTLAGLKYQSGMYSYNSGLKGASFAATQTTTNGITYKGTPHLYGTIYVKHNESNGQATINFELEAWIYNNPGYYPTQNSTGGKRSATADLGRNYFYTAVTGPTDFAMNISDTSPVSKNLDNFTISWKGAQHGANNQIAKYSVEVFKISNNIQTSFITQENIQCEADQGASNWLSYLIDLSSYKDEFSEGDWISWRVKSYGTNTNYNSDFVNSTTGIYINKTPSAPIVNAITSIIPVQGGTATYSANLSNIQVNRPAKNRFNNKTMIYPAFKLYRVSGSSKTEITLNSSSQFSLSVGKGTTNFSASFCSYDGIDYSPSMSVVINRNPQPSLTFITNREVECSTENLKYYLKYKLDGAISNSYQNMKYKFGLRYSTYENFSDFTEVILQELSTKNYYVETDIRDRFVNFATQTSGIYFKFFAQGFDGYDYTTEEESGVCFVPGKPSFKEIFNQENCNIISGSNGSLLNYFSGSLSLSFTKDTGYDGAILVINTEKGQYELPAALFHSESKTIVNAINVPIIKNLLEGGMEYKFNVKFTKTYLTQNTYYQTKLTNGNSLTRVKTLILGISNDYFGNNAAYKIFTDKNSNVNFTFKVVDQNGSLLDTNKENENKITETSSYGISSIAEACYLKIGDYEFKLTDFSPKYSSEYGEIKYNLLNFKSYYDQIKNALNKNGVSCLPVFFSIEDDFGSRYTAQSETGLYISCVENLENFSKIFFITNSSNETVPLPSGGALIEGMKLSFETSFTSYNTNPKCQLQISRGETEFVNYGSPFGFTTSDEAVPGNPVEYTTIVEISTIPQIIQKDYDVKFKLLITNDTGNIYSQEFTEVYTVKEFQAGTVSITGASYTKGDENKNLPPILTLSYQIQNPGANLFGKEIAGLKIETIASFEYFNSDFSRTTDNFVYCIQENVDYNRIPYSTVIQKQLIVTDEEGKSIESSSFYGILKVTTAIIYKVDNVNFEKSYSYQTLQTTIFNEAPTISYRQNIIGINTNNVNDWSTGVLVISAITDAKNKVLFINPTCTPKKNSNNELTGYIAAIDVYSGEIDGFIIEGGSWD